MANGSQEIGSRVPTLFMVGYFLRIIPVLNIAGFAVTGAAWLQLYRRLGRDKAYAAAGLLLLAAIVPLAIEVATGGAVTPAPSITSTNATIVADSIKWVGDALVSPISIARNAVIAVALAFEAYAIYRLSHKISLVPRALTALFLATALLVALQIAIAFPTRDSLHRVAEEVRSRYDGRILTQEELGEVYMMTFGAMTQLLIASVLEFAVMLAAYVWAIISFNNAKKEEERRRKLSELGLEEAP